MDFFTIYANVIFLILSKAKNILVFILCFFFFLVFYAYENFDRIEQMRYVFGREFYGDTLYWSIYQISELFLKKKSYTPINFKICHHFKKKLYHTFVYTYFNSSEFVWHRIFHWAFLNSKIRWTKLRFKWFLNTLYIAFKYLFLKKTPLSRNLFLS